MTYKDWSNDKLFTNLIDNTLEEDVYWANIRELRSRPSDEVYKKAVELTKAYNPSHKSIGILILAQLGFKPRFNQSKTVNLYFELLNKKQDYKVIEDILYGIGHNNSNLSTNQIDSIIKFASNEITEVRQALLSAISGINNPKAIEVLINLTNDSEDSIRDWATFGLGSQLDVSSPEILEALWQRTEDSVEEVRVEAIAGLVNRNIPEVKNVIIKILESGKFGTQLLDIIQELKYKDFIPLLEINSEKYNNDKGISIDWLTTLNETIRILKE